MEIFLWLITCKFKTFVFFEGLWMRGSKVVIFNMNNMIYNLTSLTMIGFLLLHLTHLSNSDCSCVNVIIVIDQPQVAIFTLDLDKKKIFL